MESFFSKGRRTRAPHSKKCLNIITYMNYVCDVYQETQTRTHTQYKTIIFSFCLFSCACAWVFSANKRMQFNVLRRRGAQLFGTHHIFYLWKFSTRQLHRESASRRKNPQRVTYLTHTHTHVNFCTQWFLWFEAARRRRHVTHSLFAVVVGYFAKEIP